MEIKNVGKIDSEGITLFIPEADFEYFIEWRQLKTEAQILEWILHLCPKRWLTVDQVRFLIERAKVKIHEEEKKNNN